MSRKEVLMKTYVLKGYSESYNDLSGQSHSLSNLAVTITDNGYVVPPKPPKKNWRSRGRHNPGSGDYTNRWVEIGEVRTVGDSYPYFISDSCMRISSNSTHIRGEVFAGGNHIHQVTLTKIAAGPGQPEYYRVEGAGYLWRPGKNLPDRLNRWEYVYAKIHGFWSDFSVKTHGDQALQLAEDCYNDFLAQCSLSYDESPWPERGSQLRIKRTDWTLGPSEPQFSTRPESFEDEIELGVGAGVGFTNLVADAYVEAVARIPDASGMGNAVNAVQLAQAGVSALRSILTRDRRLNVGKISDAWLAYRYSYGTTKADLEEAASLLDRAANLLFTDRVRCNGTVKRNINENDVVTARCSISLETSSLSNFKSTVERYGLQLDAYAAWDLVPYSFIVDWFLDIGGLLEFARKQNFARRVDPTDCWCSIERRWINEYGCTETYYHRWRGQPPVSAASYVSHDPSGVTIVKRALDVLALAR